MPDPVIFDATSYPNKGLIIGDSAPVDGVVSIEATRDLYSAAKRAWQTDNALNRLEFPFTVIGGNILPSGASVPTFYILSDKWKLRPYESDHTWLIDGNLFPETGSLTVATVGGFTVTPLLVTNVGPQAVPLTLEQDNKLTLATELMEADHFYDHANGLLHYYRRGTTVDLVPPKTVSGTAVTNSTSLQE